MRITDDEWRRAVSALQERFAERYAGIRVDGTSHPPQHLWVRLVGQEDTDRDVVLELLSQNLPYVSPPELTWTIKTVRFGLADLEAALDALDQWIRPCMPDIDITTYYVDQDRNSVVLMVPDPDEVSGEVLRELAPRLAEGSVTIVGGIYEVGPA